MTEKLSCHNCQAACCKGNPLLVMDLSTEEHDFMKRGGNILQTVASPELYDRPEAPYPISAQIDPSKGTISWVYSKEKLFEPLGAGLGRYALIGECNYLVTDSDGWEHCGVYDQRPAVCQKFEEGSKKCEVMREIQGVPLPMAE
ncbi:MAG: YkgJ family cysteine cluster protein [Candidatus Saccharibacteria bacterium]|nr:YkgJ family cysteine cluster protein [Candidatus Saccharibacteria bacterium]